MSNNDNRITAWGVRFGQVRSAPPGYGEPVRKKLKQLTTEEKIAYLERRLRFAPEGGRVFLEEALREAREEARHV